MRTHKDIIRDAGGVAKLTRQLGRIKEPTVRSWWARGRIPAEYWPLLTDAEIATPRELMNAVPKRHAPSQAA